MSVHPWILSLQQAVQKPDVLGGLSSNVAEGSGNGSQEILPFSATGLPQQSQCVESGMQRVTKRSDDVEQLKPRPRDRSVKMPTFEKQKLRQDGAGASRMQPFEKLKLRPRDGSVGRKQLCDRVGSRLANRIKRKRQNVLSNLTYLQTMALTFPTTHLNLCVHCVITCGTRKIWDKFPRTSNKCYNVSLRAET